jgi:hypothetical protein
MRSAGFAVPPGAAKRGDPAANGIRPPRPCRDFAIDLLLVLVRRGDAMLFLTLESVIAKPGSP